MFSFLQVKGWDVEEHKCIETQKKIAMTTTNKQKV